MALTPWLLEDFDGWPGAGELIASVAGSGWSNSGTAVGTCETDTAFAPSNKCLQMPAPAGNQVLTLTLNGVVTGGLNVLGFAAKRTANAGAAASPYLRITMSAGNALDFGWNISPNVDSVILDAIEGGVRTRLYTSPNDYVLNTKYHFAVEFDSASGTVSLYHDNTLLFSGVRAALAGLDPVALETGRFVIGTTGTVRYGNFGGYSDNAYLGVREVRTGVPDADGPTQDWSVVGGAGSAFATINQDYDGAPADYLESAVINDISEFSCPVSNTNVFSVDAVIHRFYASRTDAAPVDMVGSIGEDSGWTFSAGGTKQPPQTSYQFQEDRYGQTNPLTASAWTTGDLANMATKYERTS